ncbi:MAG TPA: hypothetical protein VL225_00585 [Vicinamibacterales bacterium]|jgi:hypothetical protein|nr:hypothetical protein [Vicinamibacterales bacterium]
MDLYLLLAPVLLIPVVWLLRFAGCTHFTTGPTTGSGVPVKRINCGGPAVAADASKGETLGWDADSATAGTAGFGLVGRPKVTDDMGVPAGEVYETWRVGPSGPGGLPYALTLAEGDYKVTLKFAQLDTNPNIGGRFLVQFNNAAPFAIDASTSVHPLARKFDNDQAVHVDSSGKLTITFQEDPQMGGGTFPFINAIEITK